MRIINLPSFKGIEDGVSKTHLAVSIAIEAARHRYSKYFVNFYDLMPQLKKH
jgi:DNA replication protein DnaC